MTNPTIRIHNTETNEVIDREMTDAEFKQLKSDQAKHAEKANAAKLKAEAKAELLERLGITEDEAKLLLA